MKKVVWLGDTHDTIKGYPMNARREIGYNLDKIQRGFDPADWKPMTSVGQGVKEIRIHEDNEYRVFYVAKFKEVIYVLHSFIKKTEKTLQKEINIGKKRYSEMLQYEGKIK